jgi:hypothetical protein
MSMKFQIHSAYVAGLCPLQLLMRCGPDSHRAIVPVPAGDEAAADLPPRPSRRKRALLLLLTLGLAIGAWQLLSAAGETHAAPVAGQGPVSGRSVLLFVLILGLTIGATELLLPNAAGTRAAPLAAEPSPSTRSALRA